MNVNFTPEQGKECLEIENAELRKENQRIKEEYIMLQNSSEEYEDKLLKENQRLNNVLNELEKDIKNLYTYGIKNNSEQKDYLLNRLEGLKEFYELKESDK